MTRTDRETILKKLMTNYWLFENMLWKYWDDILYDTDRELARKILKLWYGKTDIDKFFPEQVNMEDYQNTLKTIFTYYDNKNEWDKPKV
jgi:hypothetical protein